MTTTRPPNQQTDNSINWKDIARKGVKVLSEAADIAVHLRSTTTVLGMISLGSRVVSTALDMAIVRPETYFHTWTVIDNFPLDKSTLDLLVSSKVTVEHEPFTSQNGYTTSVVIANLDDVKIGWIKGDDHPDGPFVPPGVSVEQGRQALRDFLWKKSGSECRFLRPESHGPGTLVPDDNDDPIPSQTGDQVWKHQRPFLEKGFRRALLLHGEPGVGKTNIARYISRKAGGRILRFQSRDMGNMSHIKQIIKLLSPDAVIIDDLDRAKDPKSILDDFEDIRSSSRLFIVTVNTVSKLDPAVIRRFDDDLEIKSLDQEVLDSLMLGVPEDAQRVLRGMPVTYISQYRQAYDTLGVDLAKEVLQRLVTRRELVTSLLSPRLSAAKSKAARKTVHDAVILDDNGVVLDGDNSSGHDSDEDEGED